MPVFDADNACHCGSCVLYLLSTTAAWSLYLLRKASSLVQGDVWKPRWNNYSPCSRIFTSSFVQDSLCTLFGILVALFCVVAVLHCAHTWCNVECTVDFVCAYRFISVVISKNKVCGVCGTFLHEHGSVCTHSLDRVDLASESQDCLNSWSDFCIVRMWLSMICVTMALIHKLGFQT